MANIAEDIDLAVPSLFLQESDREAVTVEPADDDTFLQEEGIGFKKEDQGVRDNRLVDSLAEENDITCDGADCLESCFEEDIMLDKENIFSFNITENEVDDDEFIAEEANQIEEAEVSFDDFDAWINKFKILTNETEDCECGMNEVITDDDSTSSKVTTKDVGMKTDVDENEPAEVK